MKNKVTTAVAIVASIAILSGAALLSTASASSGSKDDPLITLSYLTDVFKPQIMGEIAEAERAFTTKFDTQLATFKALIENSNSGSEQAAPEPEELFSVVTLSRSQVLTCSVGTEVMLRVGTATAYGSPPALVDYTQGVALSPSGQLVANHMYLVTIDGNGLRGTADLVRVLVRGDYVLKDS
ncbi:MAG: hypothetical protein FWG48_06770 [Oscillospiraceae bacterium]|nr:hypothetical protein [Oscillospiraceae bacterium]